MKIECEKSKLEPILQKASRLANKHLTLPVLSCVLLEVSGDNKLIIKSTNLDIGLETEIKVKTAKTGSVAVPAAVLLGLISSLKENNLTLEADSNNLKIYSGKNSVTIKCMPHEDFPVIPRLGESNTVKISSHDLMAGFRSVWYSASNSNIKPELSSVYIYKGDDGLVFVSTDSFRLAEKKVDIRVKNNFPHTLIPYKNVVEIIKLFEDYNKDIEIVFEKNQAAFIIDGMYVVSRLVDGNFPDYNQIIPKSFVSTAIVLKNDLINSIKVSNIFSDSFNQIKLVVDVKNKSLRMESHNNEVGESKESISASVSGDVVELSFNSKYIMDAMRSIQSESLILSFGGQGRPLIITGASDKSFVYMVMPMNR